MTHSGVSQAVELVRGRFRDGLIRPRAGWKRAAETVWGPLLTLAALLTQFMADRLPAAFPGADPGRRPNVIIIVTDDQGYGDLSCHGNPILRTPNLDRLHSESVRLTDFHAAPMCTPTRGQLLTGRDALRNGAMNVSSGRA